MGAMSADPRPFTLVSAWTATRDALKAAGVDSPVLDARALIEAAAGVQRSDILTDPYRLLSDDARARLDALTARRMAREPLAYVLGVKGFWSLELAVDARVLTPRPETETVVQVGLELLQGRDAPQILDLGVGSGAILLALLKDREDASGLGLDLSEDALRVAEANAERAGALGRARFAPGDWGQGLSGWFDLIVSNPPYIASAEIEGLAPEVSRFEPRLALDGGADGLDAYRALAPQIARLLAPGGGFALEVGAGQPGAVAELLRAAGLRVEGVRADVMGVDRVVFGRAPVERAA